MAGKNQRLLVKPVPYKLPMKINYNFSMVGAGFKIVGKNQKLLVKPAPTNQQEKFITLQLLF